MSATETNFSATITLSGSVYATVANGGCVTQSNGNDIVWYSDSGFTTPMTFQLDGPYNATGLVTFHVLIPSAATGGVFYLGVGNSSVTTFQGGSCPGTCPFDSNSKFYWNGTSQDGSTVDMSDATGNVSTGTNHSGTVATGNVGPYAINFASASSQYATWGNNVAATQVANNFTFSFWVKTSQTTTCPIMFNQLLAGSNVGTGIQFNTSSQSIISNAGNTGYTLSVNKDDGAWHNIVATFASGTFKVYIDGGSANTGTVGNTTVAYNTANPLITGTNSPLTVFCSEAVSDERFDNVVRSANWVIDNFASQSNPTGFVSLASITGFTVSTILNNYPINSSTTNNMTLTGTGTNWTSSTVFTIQNATVLTKNVTSATSATLTWNTLGNTTVTYPTVVGDGLFTANGPNLMMPEIQINFGGPIRYNDLVGHTGGSSTTGDTWLMMDTANGLRTTCDDCSNPSPINSNMAFLTETADLNTVTSKNVLSGLGSNNQSNIAGSVCASTYTLKNRGMISFAGLYVMSVQCFPNGTNGAVVALNSTYQFSTSNDDGAHWARAQDAVQSTGASWSAGTATLTVTNTMAVNNFAIISNCTPNAWNGSGANSPVSFMVQLTAATGTTISYALTNNPGAIQGQCTVIGPATAAGTPWSTALFTTGRMAQIYPIQFCTDQTLCSNNPDSSGIYILGSGANGNGTAGDPVVWRVTQSTFLTSPGSISGYQFWQSTTNPAGTQGLWQSSLSAATNPTCIAAGVASPCNLWLSSTYITDPAIPGGGLYVALHQTNDAFAQGNGQISAWVAQSIVGPYVLAGVSDIDIIRSPPTSYNFPSIVPSQYTPISGGNPGTGCIQFGGKSGSDYGLYHRCFSLFLGSTENSYIFNTSTPRFGLADNQYHDITNGLQFLWEFQTFGDQTFFKDDSPNKANVTVANAGAKWHRAMTGIDGTHNMTQSYNASWGSQNTWTNPMLTNANYGDFTVLFVGRDSTVAGTQTAMGGSQSLGNGFMFKSVTGTVSFIIELGGAGATTVACPGTISAGTWFAFIAGRKGTTLFCYKAGTATPASVTGSATSLGASWTLTLGAESDGTQNFWPDSEGKIAIWNRALCGIALGTVCASGDEIVTEFSRLHLESQGRPWGL